MSRKQTMPTMPAQSGSGVLSKFLGVLALLGMLVLVVKHPVEAAEWTVSAFGVLEFVAEGVASFINQLS